MGRFADRIHAADAEIIRLRGQLSIAQHDASRVAELTQRLNDLASGGLIVDQADVDAAAAPLPADTLADGTPAMPGSNPLNI